MIHSVGLGSASARIQESKFPLVKFKEPVFEQKRTLAYEMKLFYYPHILLDEL